MKIKIKSREEIEKTLDIYGEHIDGTGARFSNKMLDLCGKVLEATFCYQLDGLPYKVCTKDDISLFQAEWFWHPDWYEVVEPDFTEEDLVLIDFMSETLEYFMEQK